MKTNLILICLAGSLATAPLLKADTHVTVSPGSINVTTGVWTTVPEDYDGDYYFHDGHYYHGGRHEVGEFEWNGAHYKDRYEHEGKWVYGGKWEHHARKHEREHEHEHERKDK